MKGRAFREGERRVLAAAAVVAAVCLCFVTLLGVGGLPDVDNAPPVGRARAAAGAADSVLGGGAGRGAAVAPPPAAPPSCVLETCSDDWTAVGGLEATNQDPAGCSVVRSMVKMSSFKRGNITGHWCKVWRAVRACRRRDYGTFVFRDDDTILDVHAALRIARERRAGLLASYISDDSRHVTTNWFVLDTSHPAACAGMSRWWAAARWDHPEHDQRYFNNIFVCGKNGVACVNKHRGEVPEVHCRSSLGHYRSMKRQDCMRYQIDPLPHLL